MRNDAHVIASNAHVERGNKTPQLRTIDRILPRWTRMKIPTESAPFVHGRLAKSRLVLWFGASFDICLVIIMQNPRCGAFPASRLMILGFMAKETISKDELDETQREWEKDWYKGFLIRGGEIINNLQSTWESSREVSPFGFAPDFICIITSTLPYKSCRYKIKRAQKVNKIEFKREL